MQAKIIEVGPERLGEYAGIPIKLEVKQRLEVELVEGGLGGMRLHQVEVEKPYVKDYDSYEDVPTDWPKKFDISNWGFFLAMVGERLAGGAAVAFNTNEVIMLEDRKDRLCCGTCGWSLHSEEWGSRYSSTQPSGPENGAADK